MSDLLIFDSIFTEDLSNTIVDFPRLGFIDNNGQIAKVYGEDALVNAVNLWIKSKKGERLRDPLGGGYVSQKLTKPVNQDTQVELQEALIAGFEQDFQPLLTLTKLELIPGDRQWLLRLSASSRDLKLSINVEEILETQQ